MERILHEKLEGHNSTSLSLPVPVSLANPNHSLHTAYHPTVFLNSAATFPAFNMELSLVCLKDKLTL
jgi:hypothetical protein